MRQYVDLLKNILATGEERKDRTGVGTWSIFGGQLKFDLRERFPLVTIKKTLWKSAFIEMLWFIRGESNTKYLKEHDVKIWDDWADKDGNLGPVYGVQWRHWPGKLQELYTEDVVAWAGNPPSYPVIDKILENSTYIGGKVDGYKDVDVYQESVDQLKILIDMIKTNPTGRRHIVTAWNPAFIKEMGLPPCHRDFHCYVSNDGHLDLMMAIRSWDTVLGGPFNIAQYALLTHLIARATGLKPRHLIINHGDAHVYLNHVQKITEILNTYSPIDCPTELVINTDNIDIDGYKIEDFQIVGYESHPFVSFPIAV